LLTALFMRLLLLQFLYGWMGKRPGGMLGDQRLQPSGCHENASSCKLEVEPQPQVFAYDSGVAAMHGTLRT